MQIETMCIALNQAWKTTKFDRIIRQKNIVVLPSPGRKFRNSTVVNSEILQRAFLFFIFVHAYFIFLYSCFSSLKI